jgi:hypothetical protein
MTPEPYEDRLRKVKEHLQEQIREYESVRQQLRDARFAEEDRVLASLWWNIKV